MSIPPTSTQRDVVTGYPYVAPGGGGPWMYGQPTQEFVKNRVESQTARQPGAYNSRTFQVGLFETCYKNPGMCLLASLAPWCVSYHLRKRALYNDMSRYVCCGGYLPCSGRCGERSCPALCLATEVALCFPNSVAVTRFQLQDELHIMNSQWDNALIATVACCQYLACLVSCAAMISGSGDVGDAAYVVDNFADLLTCLTCTCCLAQIHYELNVRDGRWPPTKGHAANFPSGPTYMAAPTQMQMQ